MTESELLTERLNKMFREHPSNNDGVYVLDSEEGFESEAWLWTHGDDEE